MNMIEIHTVNLNKELRERAAKLVKILLDNISENNQKIAMEITKQVSETKDRVNTKCTKEVNLVDTEKFLELAKTKALRDLGDRFKDS